jgi:aminoglycoside phosphotransferase (APT) family kinase protein
MGSGFDAYGRETLTYVEGEFADPGPWTREGAAGVGQLLRKLREATASYRPPPDAIWQPWFGRILGDGPRIIGHCDVASWNIVARDGLPVALIDWEHAGPVDPSVELAQACWLNAKPWDDAVAESDGLPSLQERAHQLRAIVDGYGLSAEQRRGFLDRVIEFAAHDTAEQADEAGVTSDTTDLRIRELGYNPLWALAWRARAVAWLCRNRRAFDNALA